jgi:uncharacterized protein YjiK
MYRSLLILLAATALACNNPTNKKSNSDDKSNKKVQELKDDKIYEMPSDLEEISGISFFNDSVVASIEDENGILYFYNLKQGKIVRKLDFADVDDYEDLAVAGKDIYIVNSSGIVFQIKDFASAKPFIKSFKTPLTKKNDIEGLTYQPKLNRLLLGVKGRNLDKSTDNKQVYAFDLKTMQLDTVSVYKLQLSEIESYFSGDAIEEHSKKFLKALGNENISKVFNISAITINPDTDELLLLSSINNLVAVLSPDGNLKNVYSLDNKKFKQPEGIAFSTNRKLYISNESGGRGTGNIIEINYAN